MFEFIDAGGRRKDVSTIGDFIDAIRSGTIADETLMRRKGDVSWTKALDHIDYRSTIGLMSNVPGQDEDHAGSDGAPPAYRPHKPAVVEAAVENVVVRSREETSHGYRGSGRPAGLPDPERHLRRLKTWLWICTAGFVAVAAVSLLYVKAYAQLADAVDFYGYGGVPPEAFPDTGSLGAVPSAVQIGAYILITISVIVMTHRARLTAESLGISGFYWSRLWTVIGFLLPFINLVRPWLGLGETRRAIMNSVRSGRIGGEWSQEGGTSFATLGLALFIFANRAAARTIIGGYKHIGIPISAQEFERAAALEASLLAADLLLAAAVLAYFVTLLRALRTVHDRQSFLARPSW